MTPETKALIFAAVFVVLGLWCAYLMRGKSEVLPPASKDTKRNSTQAVP